MPIRLPSSILIAAVLLSLLTPSALQDCLAQIPSKAADAAARSATRVNEPAFDKLELFGFLAAGPNDAYASQVVHERGTNFTPDAKFIASFPSPGFQVILRSIQPRTSKTLSSDRDRAYELLRKAWDEEQNRQWAAASKSFEQALQLAPNSATLHLAYAACLLFPQNYREAEAQTRQSLKLWPDNAAAHATLALSLTPQKQFAEAEAESRKALRISPKDHSAMFTLGVSLAHQQKYEEAIPFLQNAIAILPRLPELKKLMGVSLIETGEVARGIDQLDLYVKAAPGDAEAHYYLGVGLRLKGTSAEAHAQFAEALRLQPNNPQYEAATYPDATQSSTGIVTGPKPEDGSVSENMYTNKFFGFTYQFPKGWAVLSSDATRATLETGMALMSTGDPIEVDVKKAAARMGHPLLYVADSGSGNQAISMQTVMVSALDSRPVPGFTPRSYLQSQAQRVNQTRVQMEFSEIPKEVTVAGRSFWKNTFVVQTSAGTRYGSQFAAADKGYLLLFTFGSLNLASLSEIEKSLESIHFQESSN